MVEYVDLYFPQILPEQPQVIWTPVYAHVQLHLQLALRQMLMMMQELLQLLVSIEVINNNLIFMKKKNC